MTESSSQRLSRRTFLIDRDFQLKYAALLVFAGVLIALAFAVMTYLAFADAHRAAEGATPRSIDSLSVVMLFVAAIIAGGAMGLVGLVVTHRIAGPVYVMTHYVTALSRGSFPPIRPLRRNDELKNFFERFQAALESLKAREAEEARTIQEALAALEGVSQSAEAKAAVERLAALHDRKRAAVESRPTPIGSA